MRERVKQLNQKGTAEGAGYVLYWCQMNRRVEANHALAFAIELADGLQLPVLFYEGLTCTYPYASDRLHTFILEGVPDTARRLAALGIGYAFYLRRTERDPNDVLYRLAAGAAAVVTDDYPVFVTRRHNASVAAKLDRSFYAVDSSCVVPMRSFPKREYGAYTLRPKIARALPRYLEPIRVARPKRRYTGELPGFHTCVTTRNIPELVRSCAIDHTVPPSVSFRGGRRRAEQQLARFLEERLSRYARSKNDPAAHSTSELSPYLHFGMISPLEVALAVREYAGEHKLMADEFLEELIVRRELSFNFALHADTVDSLAALPAWALESLRKHARDSRPVVIPRDRLEAAESYDDLWNATQRELLLRGKIHGYYRMYWGKKIIEWSRTPEEALETMIYLNDRYALDGRDPNGYANILWCFGLHDRPWGERPVFGKVRYMSREGMNRKTDVSAYIEEIGRLA